MKLIYSATVYGEPVPQGRPRLCGRGRFVRAYDPPKAQAYHFLVSFGKYRVQTVVAHQSLLWGV